MVSPEIAEMKRLIQEKAKQILVEPIEDYLDYFITEASVIAESIMERYIFAVYDFYTKGESAIKDLAVKEAFTNYKIGYQQKMLDWKDRNSPEIHVSMAISNNTNLQKTSKKHLYLTAFGAGTVGAIGLTIGRCYWASLAIELLTLSISYYLFKHEKNEKQKSQEGSGQINPGLCPQRDLLIKEITSSLETWLKQGEIYSKELLVTYNL